MNRAVIAAVVLAGASAAPGDVTFDNRNFTLVLGDDAKAKTKAFAESRPAAGR